MRKSHAYITFHVVLITYSCIMTLLLCTLDTQLDTVTGFQQSKSAAVRYTTCLPRTQVQLVECRTGVRVNASEHGTFLVFQTRFMVAFDIAVCQVATCQAQRVEFVALFSTSKEDISRQACNHAGLRCFPRA
jgi:hypothetical protein